MPSRSIIRKTNTPNMHFQVHLGQVIYVLQLRNQLFFLRYHSLPLLTILLGLFGLGKQADCHKNYYIC